MRLGEEQVAAIRRIVAEETGGAAAELRLFGSRLDDAARGGDVDLFVKLSAPGLRRSTIREIAQTERGILGENSGGSS